MTRYTIDPAHFSDGEWVEIYNGCTLMPRSYESRDWAKPFKRDKKYITLAIECLVSKASGVMAGELGPEDRPGANHEWANELHGAADKLSALIGEEMPVNIRVTRQEFDHILAGLRVYQAMLEMSSRVCDDVKEIATEHGKQMTPLQIDRFCEKINCQ